jgi:hypothetical protein
MIITPESIVAISTTVTVLTQIVKKILPGDYDCYGVLINGLIALACVLVWIFSQTLMPTRTDLFNALTLYAGTWGGSVGIYETAKMMTASRPTSPRIRPVRARKVA